MGTITPHIITLVPGGDPSAAGELTIKRHSATPVTIITIDEVLNAAVDFIITPDVKEGTTYYVVTDNVTPPSATQIIAGTNAADEAVPNGSVAVDYDSGSDTLSPNSVSKTGLTNDAASYIHAVTVCGIIGTDQTVSSTIASSASFTPAVPVGIVVTQIGATRNYEGFSPDTTIVTGALADGMYVGMAMLDQSAGSNRDVNSMALAGTTMTERANTWLPLTAGAQLRTRSVTSESGQDFTVDVNFNPAAIAAILLHLGGTGVAWQASNSFTAPNSGTTTTQVNVEDGDTIVGCAVIDEHDNTSTLTITDATIIDNVVIPTVNCRAIFFKMVASATELMTITATAGDGLAEIHGVVGVFRET